MNGPNGISPVQPGNNESQKPGELKAGTEKLRGYVVTNKTTDVSDIEQSLLENMQIPTKGFEEEHSFKQVSKEVLENQESAKKGEHISEPRHPTLRADAITQKILEGASKGDEVQQEVGGGESVELSSEEDLMAMFEGSSSLEEALFEAQVVEGLDVGSEDLSGLEEARAIYVQDKEGNHNILFDEKFKGDHQEVVNKFAARNGIDPSAIKWAVAKSDAWKIITSACINRAERSQQQAENNTVALDDKEDEIEEKPKASNQAQPITISKNKEKDRVKMDRAKAKEEAYQQTAAENLASIVKGVSEKHSKDAQSIKSDQKSEKVRKQEVDKGIKRTIVSNEEAREMLEKLKLMLRKKI